MVPLATNGKITNGTLGKPRAEPELVPVRTARYYFVLLNVTCSPISCEEDCSSLGRESVGNIHFLLSYIPIFVVVG